MRKLLSISFIASAVLVGQSFADFGATTVYQTNTGTSWNNQLVDISSNSLLFNISDDVKLVDLDTSTSNTITTFDALYGFKLLNEEREFVIKDYNGNNLYDIFHYDKDGVKLKEFLNISYISEILFDNSGNLLTYFDVWSPYYEGNITSIAPNGSENFTTTLDGIIHKYSLSSDKNSIFATTYNNSFHHFYILDSLNGNVLSDINSSSFNIEYTDDGSNLFMINEDDNISSFNITSGNLNWKTPFVTNYNTNIDLIENNQILMLTSSDNSNDNHIITLIDTTTGNVNCSTDLGDFNYWLSNSFYIEDNNLIISILKNANFNDNEKLVFTNPTNCNTEYSENITTDSYYSSYKYLDVNNSIANPINYIPILKDDNSSDNVEFVRFNTDGTVLSSTVVGTDAICETVFARTKENNFYFLTDDKLTAINEAGEKIAEVSVTDTTDCYYRRVIARDDKIAVKTGDGTLKVYELDLVISVPDIPEDNTTTVIIDDYTDIVVIDNNTTTTDPTIDNTQPTLILTTSGSTTLDKKTPINLTLIKDNVTGLQLSANDNSVNFTVTSDSITVNFNESGTFNIGVSGLDLNSNYIESNLTFTVANNTPISQNETFNVNSNETLSLNNSQYFYDADGDALVLDIVNYPSIGIVVLQDNKIIYKPESSSYTTTFDVKATDVEGSSTTATFTVNSIYQSVDTLSVNSGWNLLGNSFTDKTISTTDIVESDEEVWVFDNNTWSSTRYSGTLEIKSKQGFWLYSNSDRDITINAINNNSVLTPASSGWSLMSGAVDSTLSQLHFGYNKIYTYDSAVWYEGTANPNYELKKFKGYWGRK